MSFALDRTSGSSDVAVEFLGELERWASTDVSTDGAALRAKLVEWLRAAQGAQPSMALIHQLAARALDVVNAGLARGERPAELRTQLHASCAAEMADLRAAGDALSRQAVGLLTERGSWIATLSASGAVRDAFLQAHAAGREPRALIGESRPGLEGRALAATLAAAGIPVWIVADAALPLMLSQARMVWLGADAVTDRGVLNKIGSYAVVLAAREHSVPVYTLASRRKFLPANTLALRIAEMPEREIWESPPPGVRARNIYFELVPLPFMTGVAVEDGVLPPGEAAAVARERSLPEVLNR